MIVRCPIPSAGAGPVAVLIARIAASRRIVVPFAPIYFFIAAATAATASRYHVNHDKIGAAKAEVLQVTRMTLRSARFTAATAAAPRLTFAARFATACRLAATGRAALARFPTLGPRARAPGHVTFAITEVVPAGELASVDTARIGATAARFAAACRLTATADVAADFTPRLARTSRFASARRLAGTIGFASSTAAAMIVGAAEKVTQTVCKAG
jgi:hypothetical protein